MAFPSPKQSLIAATSTLLCSVPNALKMCFWHQTCYTENTLFVSIRYCKAAPRIVLYTRCWMVYTATTALAHNMREMELTEYKNCPMFSNATQKVSMCTHSSLNRSTKWNAQETWHNGLFHFAAKHFSAPTRFVFSFGNKKVLVQGTDAICNYNALFGYVYNAWFHRTSGTTGYRLSIMSLDGGMWHRRSTSLVLICAIKKKKAERKKT